MSHYNVNYGVGDEKKGSRADGGNRVFIGNISGNTSQEELKREVEIYGKIKSFHMKKCRPGSLTSTYGVVEFEDSKSAERVVQFMNNSTFDGAQLKGQRIHSSKSKSSEIDSTADNLTSVQSHSGNFVSAGSFSTKCPGEGNCFACGKPGHWSRECPLRQSTQDLRSHSQSFQQSESSTASTQVLSKKPSKDDSYSSYSSSSASSYSSSSSPSSYSSSSSSYSSYSSSSSGSGSSRSGSGSRSRSRSSSPHSRSRSYSHSHSRHESKTRK